MQAWQFTFNHIKHKNFIKASKYQILNLIRHLQRSVQPTTMNRLNQLQIFTMKKILKKILDLILDQR